MKTSHIRFSPLSVLLTTLLLLVYTGFCSAQAIGFTEQPGLLPAPHRSGIPAGVFDLNGDGRDDIVHSDGDTIYTALQTLPNQVFSETMQVTNLPYFGWAQCGGDVDNNGYNDILWADGQNVIVLLANGTGTGYTQSYVLSNNGCFPQGCNFSDIDNDGKLDAFICNDYAASLMYRGDGAGNWTHDTLIDLATVPVSNNSGNYASIWTDINNDGFTDLYITRCKQGVTQPTDPRRINQVFLNNGNYTYTQDTLNTSNLRIGAQSWSTAFGDIDNDGDMDAYVMNYDVESNFMLNSGSGVFSDITATAGVFGTTTFYGIDASFHDFDNDGFTDLMISGTTTSPGSSGHRIYRNNGNNTFTMEPAVFDTVQLFSYGIGDLNHDGALDVLASAGSAFTSSSNPDRVWINNGNNNHWLVLQLQGVQSNRSGIGARVFIYGPWGVQVREVRSGEAYGIQNSLSVHFGLGAAATIDSVIVHWPSGITDQLNNVTADQFIPLAEGGFPTAAQTNREKTLEVNVLPNPVNGNGAIRISNFNSYGLANLSLSVFDITGKQVYSENKLTRCIIPVDRNLLSKGMYFYEVRKGNERLSSGKFIIE